MGADDEIGGSVVLLLKVICGETTDADEGEPVEQDQGCRGAGVQWLRCVVEAALEQPPTV